MLRKFYGSSVRLAFDSAIFALAFLAAYFARFEGLIPLAERKQLIFLLPYLVLLRMASTRLFGVYRIAWRFVSMRDVPRVFLSIFLPSALFLGLRLGLPDAYAIARVPISIIAVETLLSFFGVLGARVARRWFVEQTRNRDVPEDVEPKRVLLIGAGQAGYVIAREIRSRRELGMNLIGFVDDDIRKQGQTIDGAEVLGPTAGIPELVARYQIDHLIITIAHLSSADMRRIMNVCETVSVRVQIVPALHEIVDGTVSISRIRDVQVEDLLGREAVKLDVEAIGRFVSGNSVLVTGAGGSIGSEMCRQVCRFGPEQLVLVERAENNLFDINRELTARYPDLRIVPCLADINDDRRLAQISSETAPRVVIHAAAYKHVPLVEQNTGEAVKNNVFGTMTVAEMAHRSGAEACVIISTDKAVNPTSVMGATKRVAEMHVQALAKRSQTRFITVRFGNVLGSVGSVLPIFKEQIAKGGPVTVTHPEMRRYFMTIPESSQLVLQAATMGEGGEIFVLDMGQPIKVITLAEQLIRLSGLRPYHDIDIVFTGMRPGEKLFEEIALDEEAVSKTKHSKIYVGKFPPVSGREIESFLRELSTRIEAHDTSWVRPALLEFVSRERTGVITKVGRRGEQSAPSFN